MVVPAAAEEEEEEEEERGALQSLYRENAVRTRRRSGGDFGSLTPILEGAPGILPQVRSERRLTWPQTVEIPSPQAIIRRLHLTP